MIGLALGLALYNLLGGAVFLLACPFLAAACLLGDEKWRQRCGASPRSVGPVAWLHAASVGEVMMIRPLLSEVSSLKPGLGLALSTMTGTGRQTAARLLGGAGSAFFFPLDFPWSQLRAINRLKPMMVVVCETELWPNLFWLCQIKKIPLFLVNARLSPRSFSWYRALKFLFGPLLARASLIACQSQADAGRFAALAGPGARIMVAGNLKYDSMATPPTNEERAGIRSKLGIATGDLVLVAGSTREGEEEILLKAWQEAVPNSKSQIPNHKLIIAPRHPERFGKVAALLDRRKINFARRSRSELMSDGCRAMLWDTLGELAVAYQAGDLALVGGSLVPVGGHNPLEPAALGLPVIFGPHMFNAAESAASLLEAGGAVQIGSAGELSQVLVELGTDREKRIKMGALALAAVQLRRGAARRTAEAMSRLLGE